MFILEGKDRILFFFSVNSFLFLQPISLLRFMFFLFHFFMSLRQKAMVVSDSVFARSVSRKRKGPRIVFWYTHRGSTLTFVAHRWCSITNSTKTLSPPVDVQTFLNVLCSGRTDILRLRKCFNSRSRLRTVFTTHDYSELLSEDIGEKEIPITNRAVLNTVALHLHPRKSTLWVARSTKIFTLWFLSLVLNMVFSICRKIVSKKWYFVLLAMLRNREYWWIFLMGPTQSQY